MENGQKEYEPMKAWQGLSIGILVGVSAGAVLGMLYAPKKGKYLRADIGRKAGEIIDGASEVVRTTVDKARSLTRNIGVS